MTQVLEDYGYKVRADWDAEQQFCCDMHGDGRDTKPSARVYPASNSWYCFACGRTRDVITTIREKEGKDFYTALGVIEKRFNLPPLPWADADDEEEVTEEPLVPSRTHADFESEKKRLETYLLRRSQERVGGWRDLVKAWQAFDTIVLKPEEEAAPLLSALRERLMKKQ